MNQMTTRLHLVSCTPDEPPDPDGGPAPQTLMPHVLSIHNLHSAISTTRPAWDRQAA